MIKGLFEFNSPETIWLRQHRGIVVLVGNVIASAALAYTATKIIKERRN